jgi:hypothetical protein
MNTATQLLDHAKAYQAAALIVRGNETGAHMSAFRELSDMILDLVEADAAFPHCDPYSGRVVYAFDLDGSKLALDFWQFTFEAVAA